MTATEVGTPGDPSLDLDLDRELDSFEDQAREFLEAHVPRTAPATAAWGVGDDTMSSYAKRSPAAEHDRIERARWWKRLEFDAGYGWITGPTELGGGGRTADHLRRYGELRAAYAVPSTNVYTISLGMVAPAILQHGQPQIVRKYVTAMHRGDLIGCQLFSEPGAGSDVAGLSTRAVRDGDEWVINGQKVWTSEAHHADVGLLLARSNVDAPKHQGITAFAIPMSLTGIDVRPLTMMTGGTEFNEVFFDDVRLPDSYRLGAVDAGWGVAISVLMNERALGTGDAFGLGRAVERLRMMASMPGLRGNDPVIRQQLARIITNAACIRYQALAADGRRKAGLPPGPAESVFKLANTEALRLVAQVAGEMLGPSAVADTGEWGTYAWGDLILTVPGMRVAGGTDEVMRNILAERVLGLPKEP
ncbi:MAG: acyl-CoA dehydrogenase [Ilumatobacteraceae bacterium]|nr:acyl-CoA dehydrogenase [Ilumatobacteraceae bacterium]